MTQLSKFNNGDFSGVVRINNFPLAMKWRPSFDEKNTVPTDMAGVHVGTNRGDGTQHPSLYVIPPDGTPFADEAISVNRETLTFARQGTVNTYLRMTNGVQTSATFGYPLGISGRYYMVEVCYAFGSVSTAGDLKFYFNGSEIYSISIGVAGFATTGINEGNLAHVKSVGLAGNMLSCRFTGVGTNAIIICKLAERDQKRP